MTQKYSRFSGEARISLQRPSPGTGLGEEDGNEAGPKASESFHAEMPTVAEIVVI